MHSYGGASQFAGGGFLNNNMDSASPEQRKNFNSPETMRSMTVAQLLRAEFDDSEQCIFDGQPVKNVTLVGTLASKNVSPTSLELELYDGTGTISIKKYLEENDGQEDTDAMLVLGKYVRVYGNFKKSIEGAHQPNHIFAFEVRPVTDHNEVVFHNLDVIFQHMYITKGQNLGAAGNSGSVGIQNMGAPYGAAGGGMAGGAMPLQPQGMGGADNVFRAVLAYLQTDEVVSSETGAHISKLVQVVGAPELDVKRAIERAMIEGHAYSTTNEETYKIV